MRYLRTLFFAVSIFLNVWVWLKIMPWLVGQERVDAGWDGRLVGYARRFRHFAIALGGVLIKVGQFASARADVLPEVILKELSGLQDEVPSIAYPLIREALERELGAIDSHFKTLAETPIAAASLGQVYRGQLVSGERVVVKVLRPGIRDIVHTDIDSLRVIGRWANRIGFIRRRANMPALVEEFGVVLQEELSYSHEAQNAARFAKMFKDDKGIYIPEVFPQHSTDSVLTLEDVTSIKISDYAAIDAAGIDRALVARRLMDCYLKQVFEERFFHADPHPGNLFIYPLPEDGKPRSSGGRPFYLIFVDFGMTGSLTPQIAAGLMDTLTAVISRDAHKLITSYQKLGLLLPDADVERITEATRAAFDKVWGMDMSQIRDIDYDDVRDLSSEFNDLIYDMPFQMPQDFIYLGKTMGMLSGMATSIDPNFNPWQELQPFAQKLLAREISGGGSSNLGWSLVKNVLGGNGSGALLDVGRSLLGGKAAPASSADSLLNQLDRGDLTLKVSPSQTYRKQMQRLEAQQNKTTRAVLFAGVFVSATLLVINGLALPALGCYALSVVALWGALFGGERG